MPVRQVATTESATQKRKSNSNTGKGPLPLVLAVTGHRDLVEEDQPALRQQVEGILRDLLKRYPFTPLRLLSGLAEGADRLVARLAVENGVELVACLPMERSLYEKDFETKESRHEFDELIGNAKHVITLPLVDGIAGPESFAVPGPKRDLQYEGLGKYLVAQCQILIALWDGEDNKLTGGTSSVVNLQRYGGSKSCQFDPENPLDYPDTGPVYHIPTRRKKDPGRKNISHTWRPLYHPGFASEEAAEKSYNRVFKRTNSFNRDEVEARDKLAAVRAQSREWLIPRSVQLPESLNSLVESYSTADALALRYQRHTRRSLRLLIFAFGMGGLFLFELFADGPERIQVLALLVYIIVISLAYVTYKLANFRELKTRHLDYRALAEGLRLQLFWRLAGLTAQVADHYLRKQKTELDWIRNAIRIWNTPVISDPVKPDLSLVSTHWIKDEQKFFEKAAKRNTRRHASELRWNRLLLWALFFLAVGTLAFAIRGWSSGSSKFPLPSEYFYTRSQLLLGFDPHGLVIIAMTMLPALAGAITAYSLKMAFGEQRKQYARMANLYLRGAECLEETMNKGDHALARRIVFELGKEALTENGDWVLLHRERMVEMFVGG